MVDGGSHEFDRYDFPGLIDQVQKDGEQSDVFAKSLDEQDLALAVHLGKYFDRRTAETLRTEIRAKKRSYDLEGGLDVPKTPFALRNVVDPIERQFVVGNIGAFSTVHGCTGGCDWCCFDANITRDLETIPIAQKQHFFDEMAIVGYGQDGIREGTSKELLSSLLLYGDNDPFDDLDLVDLMVHTFNRHGVTPVLSTVVPRRGEENFRYLTEIAGKYRQLDYLRQFRAELAKITALVRNAGLKNVNELFCAVDRKGAAEIIEAFVRTLRNISDLRPDLIELILLANGDQYDGALKVYDLGCVKDYLNGKDLAGLDRIAENKGIQLINGFDLDFLRGSYSRVSAMFGSVDLETLNFDEIPKDITRLISDLETSLKGLPNIGNIRVSRANHRAKVIDVLKNDGRYHFNTDDRDDTAGQESRTAISLAGKNFFDSGKKSADYGIACFNGMQLSPFGLLNRVAGYITHDFPQGRLLVPYKGLIKGNELAKSGDSLGSCLKNVVVLKTVEAFREAPESIYVYDGDQRVRRIIYDHETYQIVSDKVVMENVESLADLEGLPKTWWGEALY